VEAIDGNRVLRKHKEFARRQQKYQRLRTATIRSIAKEVFERQVDRPGSFSPSGERLAGRRGKAIAVASPTVL
jgi:hypothetical protein